MSVELNIFSTRTFRKSASSTGRHSTGRDCS